jgi:hypothetical protein
MSVETEPADWSFLTNHAQVLVCIAREPEVRLRDLGDQLGITERADAGYITRQRNGRRNHYTINAHLPLPDPIAREQNIGELLNILTVTHASPRPAERTATIT